MQIRTLITCPRGHRLPAELLSSSRALLLWTAIALLGLVACSTDDGATTDGGILSDRVLRGADKYPNEGLIIVNADLNDDTITDVYSVYEEKSGQSEDDPKVKHLVRKEVDVNFDGSIDIWRHYNEAGAMFKEELDYNFDGRIDAVNFYDNGNLIRKELDIEFDQAPDVFKHYRNDELVRIERDSNNDGKIDYWEYYERGVLDRIGRDENGDGRVDRWQER